MSRVVHFEIQAENPERAMKFYTTVLDWKFQQYPGGMPYWMISTGSRKEPGIDGGLLPRRGGKPVDGASVNCYVCTVDVASIDAAIKNAVAAGGVNVVPKMPVPGVGWLAYCKDTEGNIFGMMQNDPAAK